MSKEIIIRAVLCFVVVSLCACSRSKNDHSTRAHQYQKANAVYPLDSNSVSESRLKLLKGQFATNANRILDEAIKNMDDFSALLGLQYARFSYDTNRYLLNYTNSIAGLTREEFLDFARDFLNAREHGITIEEANGFRGLILGRMADSLSLHDVATYRMLFNLLAQSHTIAVNYIGLENDTRKCIDEVSHIEGCAPYVVINLLYDSVRYYKQIQLSLSEKMQDECLGLVNVIDKQITDESLTKKQRAIALALRGFVEMGVKPNEAREDLSKARADWIPSDRDRQGLYLLTGVWLEALDKGLRGKEAYAYGTMKLKAELHNRYKSKK